MPCNLDRKGPKCTRISFSIKWTLVSFFCNSSVRFIPLHWETVHFLSNQCTDYSSGARKRREIRCHLSKWVLGLMTQGSPLWTLRQLSSNHILTVIMFNRAVRWEEKKWLKRETHKETMWVIKEEEESAWERSASVCVPWGQSLRGKAYNGMR